MIEPKGTIQFEELGLGTVLNRYQLLVPPNQREYAWKEREVKQLLQDFAREVLTGKPYFLGTIVTISRPDGRLEVVDGQGGQQPQSSSLPRSGTTCEVEMTSLSGLLRTIS